MKASTHVDSDGCVIPFISLREIIFLELPTNSQELYTAADAAEAFWAGDSNAENQRKVAVARSLFAAKYGPDPPVGGSENLGLAKDATLGGLQSSRLKFQALCLLPTGIFWFVIFIVLGLGLLGRAQKHHVFV